MQNEELRKAQTELENSGRRYSDFYDFAPVGYFVLDKDGVILDLNLTGTILLGMKNLALLMEFCTILAEYRHPEPCYRF